MHSNYATANIYRATRLADRLNTGTKRLGQLPDREALAVEIALASHDVVGALTASRVALADAAIGTSEARDLEKAARQAIIDAERAVMRYRDAILAPHGVKPWDAERRR